MIHGLDHINIETRDLDKSVSFYRDVLGLEQGWRPDFGVPGAWMYTGDQPIIHLVVRDKINDGPTGAIHHLAVKASKLESFKARLEEYGLVFTETVVPDLHVTQVFVKDPNNVTLELNFYSDAVAQSA